MPRTCPDLHSLLMPIQSPYGCQHFLLKIFPFKNSPKTPESFRRFRSISTASPPLAVSPSLQSHHPTPHSLTCPQAFSMASWGLLLPQGTLPAPCLLPLKLPANHSSSGQCHLLSPRALSLPGLGSTLCPVHTQHHSSSFAWPLSHPTGHEHLRNGERP